MIIIIITGQRCVPQEDGVRDLKCCHLTGSGKAKSPSFRNHVVIHLCALSVFTWHIHRKNPDKLPDFVHKTILESQEQ